MSLPATYEFTPPPGPPPSRSICSQDSGQYYHSPQPSSCAIKHGTEHHSTKCQTRNESNSNHDTPKSIPALPPLLRISHPLILPPHLPALYNHGFTTLTCPSPTDQLVSSAQAVLDVATSFFALPRAEKERFRTESGSGKGWSRVEGEKEMVTVRMGGNGNEPLVGYLGVLVNEVREFWRKAVEGGLRSVMECVEGSLGLEKGRLGRFVGEEDGFGGAMGIGEGEGRMASMVRVFRYEGCAHGDRDRIVAEAHCDLGLLSLVIASSPGLEVWNRASQSWFPIEKSYSTPAATVLVGRQLERLTNGRYVAGGHRVVAYGDKEAREGSLNRSGNEENGEKVEGEKNGERYRYSVVLALRAHSPVVINTDDLTTEITGPFREPLRGVTADELFREVGGRHFNINTGLEERDEQRRKLAEGRRAGGW